MTFDPSQRLYVELLQCIGARELGARESLGTRLPCECECECECECVSANMLVRTTKEDSSTGMFSDGSSAVPTEAGNGFRDTLGALSTLI